MASARGNGRQSRRRPAAGDIESLYRALSAELSPTGWWPADTTFEIMVGAVLTQNTAWGNVDRPLAALKAESMLDPHALTVVEPERLQELIRPSGFYVNKSKTLRSLSRWNVERCDASPEGADGITAADTPTVDFVLGTPVKAKAIRLTNTLQDTKVYINVAEIQVFAQDSTVLTPQPASDATLGDLRLDGETVEGFDPAKTDYTVDLPVDAEANPVLQAFATDNAAAVKVTGDAVENGKLGGKAAITVTSADESETKTYTVTFNAFTLASLKVIGPTKTEYAIGDKLDTAGLKVTAVYQSGDKTKEVPVALDDPQLAIGSFDSTTAGKKAITVSYRGVTATFNVTVKANAVAPGPEEQKPGNTNKPGATGNGNKNTVANTGSNVAAIAGAVALLAAAAGALFMLRKRA